MTVLKKCDSCRSRKIKCDEKKPACSPCEKSALDCVYKHCRQTSVFVHEQLDDVRRGRPNSDSKQLKARNPIKTDASESPSRRSSTAVISASLSLDLRQQREVGKGVAQVFTFTIRPAKPSRKKQKQTKFKREPSDVDSEIATPSLDPLLSIETGLGLRWHLNFYESPCGESKDASIYDIWTKAVPSLIGHANYLDLAITYFIDGMKLLLDRNEANEKRVCVTGQRALKSLRRTVEDTAHETDPAHVLIAITMHRYAESFKGLNTNNHVPHMQAISRIVRQIPTVVIQNRIAASIKDNLFEDEVLESLLRGSDSCFDKFDALMLPTKTSDRTNDAFRALQDLYVRVPRLARLVRSIQEHDGAQFVDKTYGQAYELAEEIYISSNNSFIKEVLSEESIISTTTCTLMPPIDDIQSFDFKTGAAFVLAAKYYTYRILLCSILLTLCSLEQGKGRFDEGEIRAQDISVARAVAMCVEYALGGRLSHPLIAMRLFLPVQMAFGTWYRVQKAERNRELFATPEYETAVRMKRWCLGITRELDHIWGNIPTDQMQLERLCEMFAGGPLLGGSPSWVHSETN